MILPNVRASFGRSEAGTVVGLLAGGDGSARDRLLDRIRDQGFDSLLDDPRTLNAALTARAPVSEPLLFYLLVRHALLETGIDDRTLADYIAALLVAFGHDDRALHVTYGDPDRFLYLVDLLAATDAPDGRRRFLVRAHLGNYALWLSGIFPDYITARVQRRGAPGLDYFEAVGASGYRLAAITPAAAEHGLDHVLRTAADAFPDIRVALNRISDRYFFRSPGSIERLLRQVRDSS